jgi:PadR family transcriptional regulator AphA
MNDQPGDQGSDRRLTTTSYAILGLLSIQPWSTYELAKLMHRSLDRIWPRVESSLYNEPRKLVRAGLAASESQMSGRRRRTEYQITDAGRSALRAWLADETVDHVAFECAPLVQVYFGENGTTHDILAAIARIRANAESELRHWIEVATAYAEGRGRFPGRIHVNTLILQLAWDLAIVRLAWADWATREVAGWSTAGEPTDVMHFQTLIAEILGSAARSGVAPDLPQAGVREEGLQEDRVDGQGAPSRPRRRKPGSSADGATDSVS